MAVSRAADAAGFDGALVRPPRRAPALQALTDTLEIAAVWSHVRLLRWECAILRLIVGES